MLSEIVPLLQQHSIDCEPVPLGDSDDPTRFLLLLRCCSHAGGVVRLSVQRELHVNPIGPVVVFHGVAGRRKNRAQSVALSQTIIDILTENGGWIPVRDDG